MLKRLARTCVRRRKLVVPIWILILVGLSVFAGSAGGTFRNDFSLPGTESQEAFDILKTKGFGDRTGEQAQIVFKANQGVDDPAVKAAMEELAAEVAVAESGIGVVSPYSEAGARQVSQDRTVAYYEINLAERDNTSEYAEAGDKIKDLREDANVEGLQIELGGFIFLEQEPGSEMFGMLFAVVILLIAFGSLLAMGLPLVTAIFGIGSGIALVQLLVNVIDMPDFTEQAVLMIGIGVGIDYALFIVTRYRQGLREGLEPEAAIVRSIDTSGRAVLFAGTTVVISLGGLMAMGLDMMRGVAVGTSLGVIATMAGSVTLLPALLGFVGRNIDKFGLPHRQRAENHSRNTPAYRWSRMIQRRPALPAALALVALVALAIPVFSMRLGFTDNGNNPKEDTTRKAYDTLAEGFGPGFNGPLLVAAETPNGAADLQALEALATTLNSGTEGVAFATPPLPNQAGDAAIMQVFPTSSPQDEATDDLVHRLRDNVVPDTLTGTGVDAKIGGFTPSAVDFAEYIRDRLPLFMGLVLALSFLLLMLVFRSLLVPLKAVIMNLLSIGAAYGVIVAVFQWGWGASLIGVGKEGPVEAWAPMMLFAIVFGLSMDYEVFLLSRIKEEYDRTGDNATAVADGLAASARVITAAAAIMVFVFGGFVLGDLHALKLFGLGLAVAVFLDATVVRMVLVPATMELLGGANWWLPKWLDRILPRVHVEASRDDLDAELAELQRREATPVP